MKLADLLAEVEQSTLESFARDHAHVEDHMPRPVLLETIEGVLKSHRFLHEFLINRQPPTFAIMTMLLGAVDHAFSAMALSDAVSAETARLCSAVDTREILSRDDQLRIYRKVLYQARSNDEIVDPAESAILCVLRHELRISQVEHFLLEHHADLREFWQHDDAFVRELEALQAAGLLYHRDGVIFLPEDLVPVIRSVLGVEMPASSARRLYARLSNQELYDALACMQMPTSGSKEERIERCVFQMIQPSEVLRLRSIGLDRLREICRDISTNISGSKDDVVARIVGHVAAGRDERREAEPPAPIREDRRLDEERFLLLFSRLRGFQLMGILSEFDLRRWGSKDAQVRKLWDAQRSETTFLKTLSNSELEAVLRRMSLKTAGSKSDRIDRLIDYFATSQLEVLRGPEAMPDAPSEPVAHSASNACESSLEGDGVAPE